ncbi:MAG: hypothetical protein WCI47_00575 [bacterium]
MKEVIPELVVKIISPFEVMYEGRARAVSAASSIGPFDILPNHENFLTLLIQCEVHILTEVDQRRFPIQHGVLRVDNNKVIVFANI